MRRQGCEGRTSATLCPNRIVIPTDFPEVFIGMSQCQPHQGVAEWACWGSCNPLTHPSRQILPWHFILQEKRRFREANVACSLSSFYLLWMLLFDFPYIYKSGKWLEYKLVFFLNKFIVLTPCLSKHGKWLRKIFWLVSLVARPEMTNMYKIYFHLVPSHSSTVRHHY